jgi:hypothetical protein
VKVVKAGALATVGAVALLSICGTAALATPLGPAQSGMTRATVDHVAQSGSDIVLVKRRRGRRGMHRHRARPRFHRRRHYRGRRYRRGSKWYYWAPWVGAYLYFEGYDACYRSCRRRGHSRGYCRDVCDW